MKSLAGVLIAAAFATLTFATWAFLNRPAAEPPWPAHIQGFAFSPFRANEDATRNEMPTDAEIDSDLKLLTGKATAVRTYSLTGTLADVPQLAARHAIDVALGAWIDDHGDKNDRELASAIEVARAHPSVTRVFIGNEVVLRGEGVSIDVAVDYSFAQFRRCSPAVAAPRRAEVDSTICQGALNPLEKSSSEAISGGS